MSDTGRRQLRDTISGTIDDEIAKLTDQVMTRAEIGVLMADVLMPIVRAAQADAWRRGWAAGVLAHYKGTAGTVPATPYSGGRHVASRENPVPGLGPEVFDGQVWHRTNLLPSPWIMP